MAVDSNNCEYFEGCLFFYPKGAGRSGGIVQIHECTGIMDPIEGADRWVNRNRPYISGRVVAGQPTEWRGKTSGKEKGTVLFYPQRGIIINQALVDRLQRLINMGSIDYLSGMLRRVEERESTNGNS